MKFSLFGSGVVAVALLGLVGCGGGSGDPETVTKVIMDDPIAGLGYQCSPSAPSEMKKTNNKGEFTCVKGDKVAFFLGKYKLGETNVSSGTADTLRIKEVVGDDETKATHARQLLQSIDDDGDNSVITIPDGYDALDDVEVELGDANFTAEVNGSIEGGLIDAETANEHAEKAYIKLLLGGKTFYTIDKNDGNYEIWKLEINSNVTQVTDDENEVGTMEIKKVSGVWGIYVNEHFFTIQKVTEKGIEFLRDDKEKARFFYTKADAEAHVKSLQSGGGCSVDGNCTGSGEGNGAGGSGSAPDSGNYIPFTEALLSGKTFYWKTTHDNQIKYKKMSLSNGTMYMEKIKILDGNMTHTTEQGTYTIEDGSLVFESDTIVRLTQMDTNEWIFEVHDEGETKNIVVYLSKPTDFPEEL